MSDYAKYGKAYYQAHREQILAAEKEKKKVSSRKGSDIIKRKNDLQKEIIDLKSDLERKLKTLQKRIEKGKIKISGFIK